MLNDKKDSISELFKETLDETNERLDALNMLSFSTLWKYKDRYIDEYKTAKTIFEFLLKKKLKQKVEQIKKSVMETLEKEVMEAFNDNL